MATAAAGAPGRARRGAPMYSVGGSGGGSGAAGKGLLTSPALRRRRSLWWGMTALGAVCPSIPHPGFVSPGKGNRAPEGATRPLPGPGGTGRFSLAAHLPARPSLPRLLLHCLSWQSRQLELPIPSAAAPLEPRWAGGGGKCLVLRKAVSRSPALCGGRGPGTGRSGTGLQPAATCPASYGELRAGRLSWAWSGRSGFSRVTQCKLLYWPCSFPAAPSPASDKEV